MDDDIVTTFHSNNALEIVMEKMKPNIEIIQLPKLMEETLSRPMSITLQQGVSWEPIWDPTKNPIFWYDEGMLPSLIALETNLSQI
jgi:hypothetical protein